MICVYFLPMMMLQILTLCIMKNTKFAKFLGIENTNNLNLLMLISYAPLFNLLYLCVVIFDIMRCATKHAFYSFK